MAFINGKEVLFSSEITVANGTDVTVNGEKVNTFDADTKLDKKGVSIEEHAGFLYVYKLGEDGKRTGQYVRMRGDIFEAFFKSDTAQVQGQYTINGAELYRKEFDENGNVIKSFNTKYRRDVIEGNNDDGKYFKLKLPRAAGTRTLATTDDISTRISNLQESINTNITTVTNDLKSHKTRLGYWYDGETMSKGVVAALGRMYLFTGVGLNLVTENGGTVIDTSGAPISVDGAKAVALILPNTVDHLGLYRCKAIWTSGASIFGNSINAKDFTLLASEKGVKITATGGTTMWTI